MLTLTSDNTYQIPGRGTIKVVLTTPETQTVLRQVQSTGEPVEIDCELWTVVGIEVMGLHPQWGLVVRRIQKSDAPA